VSGWRHGLVPGVPAFTAVAAPPSDGASNDVSASSGIDIGQNAMLADMPFGVGMGAMTNFLHVDDNSDLALNGDVARTNFGVTGVGLKIGILSDSFNRLGGAASDVANGDLPAGGVTVLEEGPVDGADEGRAMAQLVHRIAPGAQIYFHTAFNGEADFAQGIRDLAAAGAAAA
jgi:hypothetical protein